MDCAEFQRLRHIRQNGLTNFVFHGAEHSRFAHSMGVAHVAREMYQRIERNCDTTPNLDFEVLTTVAALLHDVGHGPFSHTLEEILRADDIDFDHEAMTQRMIEEEGSALHHLLRSADSAFPKEIVYYIRKKERQKAQQTEHWRYRLVSSQLDADRLDYLLRDSMFLERHARELTTKLLPFVDAKSAELYVCVDEPDRTSYKRYDWRSEDPDESIWLVGGGRKPSPIEDDRSSKIVQGLKETQYFHRLVLPEEIRVILLRDKKSDIEKLQGAK